MRAACATLPARWFYEDAWSDFRQEPWPEGEERARRICCSCPIQEQCLVGALERKEAFGVWAGTNPRDRRGFLRRKLDTGLAMMYFGFRQEKTDLPNQSSAAEPPNQEGTLCPTK